MDTPHERDDSLSLSQPEAAIRAFLAQQAYEQAATTLLQRYADEILGYLVNALRDRELAREAFAVFARDLWQALPTVTLKASARAWAYALARNAAQRQLKGELRRRRRELPEGARYGLPEPQLETRPATPPYLRTENKQRLAQLRERLSNAEQEILILRIDRGFEFREIAVTLGMDGDELESGTARLRKRFQLIKRKLARWLREGQGAQN